MQYFYQTYIKPMRWFWLLILMATTFVFWGNVQGYRLFKSNSQSWTKNGPGYHK